jgi:hypothetical protein
MKRNMYNSTLSNRSQKKVYQKFKTTVIYTDKEFACSYKS